MNLTANAVEIHLPQPRIAGMVWAIALFSFFGLIASLMTLNALSYPWREFPKEGLIFAFIVCLAFIFSVAGLLVWQLARLITTFRDAVGQTINRAQFEPVVQPHSVLSQPQPIGIPSSQEQMRSVTEHTTRSMQK